jgi:cytoskeletal protein RodZ
MDQVKHDPTGETDQTSLGLARRRQRKALSLKQIADATKIGVRSLQAIETEEFQKLPGGIYSTSYIRLYARAIDFDESQILALYYSVMGQDSEQAENPRKPCDSERGLMTRFLRHTSDVLGSLT